MSWTFKTLQAEQKPWVVNNFGHRAAWQPLAGMAEEITELHLSSQQSDPAAAFRDGLADIVIFMADFCSARDFDLQELYEAARDSAPEYTFLEYAHALFLGYGFVAKGFLKAHQGIRGTLEEHNATMRKGLVAMLRCLIAASEARGMFLPEVVRHVWETEVRPRDWKKYPGNGFPPAPERPAAVLGVLGTPLGRIPDENRS